MISSHRLRSEIQNKLLRVHEVLQDREAGVLAKLQELEEISLEIRLMNGSKTETAKCCTDRTLTDIPEKEVIGKSTALINASILELERKLQNVKVPTRA